jgi:hypothetical protein
MRGAGLSHGRVARSIDSDVAALQQPSTVHLQPGMPAGLSVTTAQRTLLE